MKTVLLFLSFIISAFSFSQESETVVEFPDVEAQFHGGSEAFGRYVSQSIVYPDKAIDKNIMGKVYLSFVVGSDGSISMVKVERGAHPLLDAEALRVLRAMPNWIPGEANGKKVPTRCRVPIVFTLTDDDDDDKKAKRRKRRRRR